MEEDVQWRFIESMKAVGDVLEINVEGGAHYRMILETRKVERLAALKDEASKAPMAPAVTPAADAPIAPDTGAAEL